MDNLDEIIDNNTNNTNIKTDQPSEEILNQINKDANTNDEESKIPQEDPKIDKKEVYKKSK